MSNLLQEIEAQIAGVKTTVGKQNVGTVRQIGDGVAKVEGLTDAMYNPADRPQVSHDDGTRLVVEYIERHWCPSTTSADLIAALR